jgi:hypothetical protein
MMSRIVIVILIYHHNKPIDLTNHLCSFIEVRDCFV